MEHFPQNNSEKNNMPKAKDKIEEPQLVYKKANRSSSEEIKERRRHIKNLLQKNPDWNNEQILKALHSPKMEDAYKIRKDILQNDLKVLEYYWNWDRYINKNYSILMAEELLRKYLFQNVKFIKFKIDANPKIKFDFFEILEKKYKEHPAPPPEISIDNFYQLYWGIDDTNNISEPEKNKQSRKNKTDGMINIKLKDKEIDTALVKHLLRLVCKNENIKVKKNKIFIDTKYISQALDTCNLIFNLAVIERNITKLELTRIKKPTEKTK